MTFRAILGRLSRRGQRVALVCILAPFYVGFVAGWMTRKPAPLFIGAMGFAITLFAYRVHVKRQKTPN